MAQRRTIPPEGSKKPSGKYKVGVRNADGTITIGAGKRDDAARPNNITREKTVKPVGKVAEKKSEEKPTSKTTSNKKTTTSKKNNGVGLTMTKKKEEIVRKSTSKSTSSKKSTPRLSVEPIKKNPTMVEYRVYPITHNSDTDPRVTMQRRKRADRMYKEQERIAKEAVNHNYSAIDFHNELNTRVDSMLNAENKADKGAKYKRDDGKF